MTRQSTESEFAELRAQLETKRERLRGAIGALRAAEGAEEIEDPLRVGTEVEDLGDRGADQTAWDLERMSELALRDTLSEIEHALAKFATQTYGSCERCGKPIPLARLRIVPEARYDVRHQAEIEPEEAAPVRIFGVEQA
jgi:DnaK suppressor protein